MVEEELEAPERGLAAAVGEREEMGGAEKPMAVDGAENLSVARREDHPAHLGALEAWPSGLGVGHPSQRTGPPETPERRWVQPPSQRWIFVSISSLGRP